MTWRDEARAPVDPKVGEIWCDFHPGSKRPWFKVEAIDTDRQLIMGHRWPTPFPDEGIAASRFIAEHPRLGEADIVTFAYFQSWCER